MWLNFVFACFNLFALAVCWFSSANKLNKDLSLGTAISGLVNRKSSRNSVILWYKKTWHKIEKRNYFAKISQPCKLIYIKKSNFLVRKSIWARFSTWNIQCWYVCAVSALISSPEAAITQNRIYWLWSDTIHYLKLCSHIKFMSMILILGNLLIDDIHMKIVLKFTFSATFKRNF